MTLVQAQIIIISVRHEWTNGMNEVLAQKRSTTLGSHNLRLSSQEPFHPAYNRTSRRSLHTHTHTHSPGYPIWMPITCRHVAKLELAFTYFVDTYERAKWMGASKCNFLTLDVFRCRNVFASNEFNYWMYIIRIVDVEHLSQSWRGNSGWMDGQKSTLHAYVGFYRIPNI